MIPVAMRSTGASAVPFMVPDLVLIIDYYYYHYCLLIIIIIIVMVMVPVMVPEPPSKRQSLESSSNLDKC